MRGSANVRLHHIHEFLRRPRLGGGGPTVRVHHVVADVALNDLGHEAVHGTPRCRYEAHDIGTILLVLKRALDGLHLTDEALGTSDQFSFVSDSVRHGSSGSWVWERRHQAADGHRLPGSPENGPMHDGPFGPSAQCYGNVTVTGLARQVGQVSVSVLQGGATLDPDCEQSPGHSRGESSAQCDGGTKDIGDGLLVTVGYAVDEPPGQFGACEAQERREILDTDQHKPRCFRRHCKASSGAHRSDGASVRPVAGDSECRDRSPRGEQENPRRNQWNPDRREALVHDCR